jgi:hypothetical protein
MRENPWLQLQGWQQAAKLRCTLLNVRYPQRCPELGVSLGLNRKLPSNLDDLIPRQVEVVDRLARIA